MKLSTLLLFIPTLAWAQPPVIVAPSSSLPTTVWTPSGSYIVVPNYSTGQPSAVVQVSKTNPAKTVDSKSTRK